MTIKRKTAALVFVFAAGLVGAAGVAIGQDGLPPAGDFALTFSLAEADGGTPVLIGPDRMARAATQTVHLFNDAGPGSFLHFAVGVCTTFEVTDVAAATIEITGYCSYRDPDGDEAYERLATDGPVALDAITIASEWLGGTGKYEDITGAFTTELFAQVQNGAMTLTGGRKTGAYEIAGAEPPPVTPPPAEVVEDTEALMAALMTEGAEVFRRNCSGCHGANGQGGAGPELAGNAILEFGGGVVGMILLGNEDHGMPPFADRLDDRQIAAVATFVRNSWGNAFGIVRETTVAGRR